MLIRGFFSSCWIISVKRTLPSAGGIVARSEVVAMMGNVGRSKRFAVNISR